MFLRKNTLFLRKQWTRKTAARIAVLGLVVGLTTMIKPLDAHAQQRFSLEGRGGIAVPASDLADLEDVGANVGVGLAYNLSPRLALRLDASVDLLSGDDSQGPGPAVPDMNVYHYNLGLGYALLNPKTTNWTLDTNVGAGGSTIDLDEFTVSGVPVDFSETYFSLNGGLKLGYNLSPSVNLFIGSQAYLMFTDEQDTALLSVLSPELDPAGFDTAWTFPVTAGFAIYF